MSIPERVTVVKGIGCSDWIRLGQCHLAHMKQKMMGSWFSLTPSSPQIKVLISRWGNGC